MPAPGAVVKAKCGDRASPTMTARDTSHRRDPNRIDRIAALLVLAWRRSPDERLGQVLENVSRGRAATDLWNMEDHEWDALLRQWLGLPDSAHATVRPQ
jgi:protein involved in temperature-dependent protein secretion